MIGVSILENSLNVPFEFGLLILTHSLTYIEKINPEDAETVISKTLFGVVADGVFRPCPLLPPAVKVLGKDDYADLIIGAPGGDFSISDLGAALASKPDSVKAIAADTAEVF